MSASLGSELFFCLFSFLFGALLVWSRELLRGLLSAFRLLPPIGGKIEEERKCFVGYLLLDLLFFLLGGASYMIFLYAAHGGVFRFYSLFLLCAGGYLFRRPAYLLGARPAFFCLNGISLPFRLLVRKCRRKKKKQLDETEQMV